MTKEVRIDSVNIGDPDMAYHEFVTLTNYSNEIICLDNWKVIWQEWPSKRLLHEHIFKGWKSKQGFGPHRKIFLTSGVGDNRFSPFKKSKICPIPHYVIYTNTSKRICNVQHLRISLIDSENNEIDHLFTHQYRNISNNIPSIVIGHGRNPAWKELKDHLQDKQGFTVEAFETEIRTSHQIPDIIDCLGETANFAIIVMTGEDEMKDGSIHPRLNVVQELGKFQERLGNNKTIILVEKGVTIPSNNDGIIYLPFDSGYINSTFGDIVATIRKEFNI